MEIKIHGQLFQNQKLFNVFFYTESQIEEILESTKKKNTGYGFFIDTFKSSAMNFFKEIKSGGKILIDLFKKLQHITIKYETYPWAYKIKEVIKLSIDGTPFLKLLDTLAITALDENEINHATIDFDIPDDEDFKIIKERLKKAASLC